MLPDKNLLRNLRSSDGGEIGTIQFELPRGMAGAMVAAVPFNDSWLAEWHSPTGKPIGAEMALPVDGELFDSRNYDGLHFPRWKNGKPAELVIVPASVEWSRTLDTHCFWTPFVGSRRLTGIDRRGAPQCCHLRLRLESLR